MPVYLPTAVIGNPETLITLGHSAEIMGWFYPSRDHAQHVHQCFVAVYAGPPNHGQLYWCFDEIWQRHQHYLDDSNICLTELNSQPLGLKLSITDFVAPHGAVLHRRMQLTNTSHSKVEASVFLYGDWNVGGIRMGNALRFDKTSNVLLQGHREVTLALGGDLVENWQCGKAGEGWGSNALRDLDDGVLNLQNLEIGDVNWAVGSAIVLAAGETGTRTVFLALEATETCSLGALDSAQATGFEQALDSVLVADVRWLQPGVNMLDSTGGAQLLPPSLSAAYRRSILCLPLLCGDEGAPIAAPEFDPEFISCGGYGYHWPRDGCEYVSGLMEAGYPQYTIDYLAWCVRHQHPLGYWEQRYFLNGQPGPNWCLAPDMLQIDQVGAVLWLVGKTVSQAVMNEGDIRFTGMVRCAAEYMLTCQSATGLHHNAFDTWESYVGSFTYSNAAIYAGLRAAAQFLGDEKYHEAAVRVKAGVLQHFVKGDDYPYLIRGFDWQGESDWTIDSASLGAIEPFGLLDLSDERELAIAEGTLRAVAEHLEVDWEGGRAIRRFTGDTYVGGVPACVNTLWMTRCCLQVAEKLAQSDRRLEADDLTGRSSVYLQTVLKRATPTGLLPELMQGPAGQLWWAAPHGWAMASFVTGTLQLAARMAKG